jgi:Flp pilus assembly protein TadD/Zn-dependent protease
VAIKFRLLGTPVVIGADFLLIMLVLGALWRTPDQLPVWMVIVTASVLLHEMGHATFFELYGMKPVVQLYGGGGMTMAMPVPGRVVTPWQRIVIAGSGPATGLVIGGMVGAAALYAPRIQSDDIVQDLLWVSLGWSLVNLLPLPGVDGGAIVSGLTSAVLRRPAELAGRVVGFAVVVAIVAVLVAIGELYWALIIGFFVFVTMARTGFRFGGTATPAGRSGGGGAAGGAASPAAQLLAMGRYQEAFNVARPRMAENPADPEPLLVASDALRLMGSYADAEIGYSQVLRLVPANHRALRGRALTLRRLGRDTEAEADLRTLLALPVFDAAPSQASALYGFERHEEGELLVASAISAIGHPAATRILTSFAAMFSYGLGHAAWALQQLDGVMPATSAEPSLRELRALILIDLGRFPEALEEVRKALLAAPQNPAFLETLGIATRMAGNAAGAYQPLWLSTEARPGDPRARAELALGQIQAGRLGDARGALETLPAPLARDPFVAYARAALAAASGSSDEAVAFLNEARRERPELGVRAAVDPLFRGITGG